MTLECIGKLVRYLKPRYPNHHSSVMYQFYRTHNTFDCRAFDVIPRTLLISRPSIDRYNKNPNPFDEMGYSAYLWGALSLNKEFPFMQESVVCSFDYVVSQLNKSTSPGCPWTLDISEKASYWASEWGCRYHDEFYDALATNDPYPTVCSVSVKEELRSRDKLDENKGRTIIAMDVAVITAQAQLFIDQSEKFVSNHLKCCSALGLSLYKGGAQRLFNYLNVFGTGVKFYSADGKQYDSCFNEEAMKCIYKFRFDCFNDRYRTDGNRKRVENLAKMLSCSPLWDIDGLLYKRLTGNPSGQFLTTQDNIIKNFLDWLWLWNAIMPEQYRGYDNWKKFTRFLFVGDDVIYSLDPVVQDLFTVDMVLKFSVKINMTYEFDNNCGVDFDKVKFIGHTFQQHNVPGTIYTMWFPHIDCLKMKCALLNFNEYRNTNEEILFAMAMCCGLRNESFMCVECREWFSDAWAYLTGLVDMNLDCYKSVQKSWMSDDELWCHYSGIGDIEIDYATFKSSGVANS